MIEHLNPSTWETGRSLEYEANLVYSVSSRTEKDAQRNSQKKKINKRRN